ncbi:MAG: hypothetical protein HFJ43_02795 [Clostridia bacterium]|nr:hypothetical protein [Clostridia bacterium]
MKKEKCKELVKVLIISIMKVEKEMTDFIVGFNSNNNLISVIAERKKDILPLEQIIDILELNDKESEEFMCDVYNIIEDSDEFEIKIDKLLEKYEDKI